MLDAQPDFKGTPAGRSALVANQQHTSHAHAACRAYVPEPPTAVTDARRRALAP